MLSQAIQGAAAPAHQPGKEMVNKSRAKCGSPPRAQTCNVVLAQSRQTQIALLTPAVIVSLQGLRCPSTSIQTGAFAGCFQKQPILHSAESYRTLQATANSIFPWVSTSSVSWKRRNELILFQPLILSVLFTEVYLPL